MINLSTSDNRQEIFPSPATPIENRLSVVDGNMILYEEFFTQSCVHPNKRNLGFEINFPVEMENLLHKFFCLPLN